jgi:hypothetical protein
LLTRCSTSEKVEALVVVMVGTGEKDKVGWPDAMFVREFLWSQYYSKSTGEKIKKRT